MIILSELNTGNTAWLIVASALVALMLPAIGIFYAGVGKHTETLSTLVMTTLAGASALLIWALIGYSVMSSSTSVLGVIGLSTDSVSGKLSATGVPLEVLMVFSGMFAAVAAALVAGAASGRAKTFGWVLFAALWVLLVYIPVSHWIWSTAGWIFKLGAIDFAGGTAVHINAGAAAAGIAVVLGRRKHWNHHNIGHNLPLTLLGAGLLSVGWIGFNAGSGLAADGIAAQALLNTVLAASAGALTWSLVDGIKDRKTTSVGVGLGSVAGLVGITPAAAAVTPVFAIVIAVLAAIFARWAMGWKYKAGIDDAGDVAAVHLIPGVVGALGIGLFATSGGLIHSWSLRLLAVQSISVVAVILYSFTMSYVLAKVLSKVLKLSEHSDDVDTVLLGETAYRFDTSVSEKLFEENPDNVSVE